MRAGAMAIWFSGLAVSAAVGLAASTASAQDVADLGMKVWQNAGCTSCHGTFAEGGGGGEQPAGPSLRRTRLDKQALKETVACGRPGTQMPYNLKGAYTETACWGLPLGAVPREVNGSGRLSAAEIDQLVEYLTARVVGKSNTVTKAECGVYYGNPNHPNCAAYR